MAGGIFKIGCDNITRRHEMLFKSDGVLATTRKYNASLLTHSTLDGPLICSQGDKVCIVLIIIHLESMSASYELYLKFQRLLSHNFLLSKLNKGWYRFHLYFSLMFLFERLKD